MSECTGETCTHPECLARRQPAPLAKRRGAISPEKWSTMNRAQRRAAAKEARRAR